MIVQRVGTSTHSTVRAIVSGNVTIEEILEAINGSIDDPDFRWGYDILSDHTRVETAITTEQAGTTAEYLASLSLYFAGSRWAVVTSKDVSYGMMRMLSVFLERVPMDLRVFRSFDEAENWLAAPKEQGTGERSQIQRLTTSPPVYTPRGWKRRPLKRPHRAAHH
jgi:hypothetical protein